MDECREYNAKQHKSVRDKYHMILLVCVIKKQTKGWGVDKPKTRLLMTKNKGLPEGKLG